MQKLSIKKPSSPTEPSRKSLKVDQECKECERSSLIERLISLRHRLRSNSLEEEETQVSINRRRLEGYLRCVVSLLGKEVSLNENGMCFFRYKKFIVTVEVPQDQCTHMYLYTMVCQLNKKEDNRLVLQKAMELNYMQIATNGSTLGYNGNEINMCYSTPIRSLTLDGLKDILVTFMKTASEINERLDSLIVATTDKTNE
jgi:hypothetical protein